MLRRALTTFARCVAVLLVFPGGEAVAQTGTVVPIGVSPHGLPLLSGAADLVVMADGAVWARGVDGIARWDGAGWYTSPALSQDVDVLALGADGVPVVAGQFWSGVERVYGVARWDGEVWASVGGEVWAGRFLTVAALPDGSLAVAGDRVRVPGSDASGVVRWTGSAWSLVGDGLSGTIESIAGGAGGALYAAGEAPDAPGAGVPVTGVMRWDGTAWASIGDITPGDGRVRQVLAAPDGRLYVRGTFDAIGGVPAENLALWTGTAWEPLGGESLETTSLALHDDGRLWAVGTDVPAADERLWAWTGSSWAPLSEPIRSASALPLTLATGPGGVAVVAGFFQGAGDTGAENAATWTPNGWTEMGARVNDLVYDIEPIPSGGAYVAGDFETVPGVAAPYVARWTGDGWERVGDTPLRPQDLAVGADGTLYAAVPGLTPVLRLDGDVWAPMAEPDGPSSGVRVATSGTDVYVAAVGAFSDRFTVYRSAGAAWEALGPILEGEMVELFVGPGNALYAAGALSVAGAAPAPLLRWDGTAWQAVLGPDNWEEVGSVALGPDGELYASGGPDGERFARYDGTDWQALPPPPTGRGAALAVTPDGRVYAGARPFWTDPPGLVAVWDGGAWETVLNADPDMSNPYPGVLAMASDGADLLIGGRFGALGSVTSPNVALYRAAVADAADPTPAPPVALRVTPNPTRGPASVRFLADGAVRVELFDTLGRRLAVLHDGPAIGETRVAVPAAALAPGVYLVRMQAADAVQTVPLTVAR